MPYVLFKRVKDRGPKRPAGWPPLIRLPAPPAPSDDWKHDPSETLLFVGLVHTPKQVAALCRQDLYASYLLFEGAITPLQIATTVHLRGVSLDSMSAEGWTEAPSAG